MGIKATTSQQTARASHGTGPHRKRTRLSNAVEASKAVPSQPLLDGAKAITTENTDSEWEEDDDEDVSAQDITLDLADPHSASGKYWKQEFNKYRDDAKQEMDKMLKYKNLAKSYAKLKDAEAVELAEKLRLEQKKVIDMEKKISESASSIVTQHRTPVSSKTMTETVSKLTKQTALAVQYRQKVQDLEAQLEEHVQNQAETHASEAASASTSSTQQTILELRDELRIAQRQARENESLRKEVSDLNAKLKTIRQESRATGTPATDTGRARELRTQLRELREESRKKDDELRKLRREYSTLQQQSETHAQEVKILLDRSQSKYAELKKEMAALKASKNVQSTRAQSWHVPPQTTEPAVASDDDALGYLETQKTEMTASQKQESLRDKYRKEAGPASDNSEGPPQNVMTDSFEVASLEPSKNRIAVRRSLRNKRNLTTNGVALSEASRDPGAESILEPRVPGLERLAPKTKDALSRDRTSEGEVDLLKAQFAKLGGPEIVAGGNSTLLGNGTARASLPPERRAAALARIEKKRLERQKVKDRIGYDKENVRPVGA